MIQSAPRLWNGRSWAGMLTSISNSRPTMPRVWSRLASRWKIKHFFRVWTADAELLAKIDLCDDLDAKLAAATRVAGGASVLTACALTGRGVKKLSELIKPVDTTVFIGTSVLVNAWSALRALSSRAGGPKVTGYG